MSAHRARRCGLRGCQAGGRADYDGFCSRAHLQAAIGEPVVPSREPIEQAEAEVDPPTERELSPVAADAAGRAPTRRRPWWLGSVVGLAVVAVLLLYARPWAARPEGRVVSPPAPTTTVLAPSAPTVTGTPVTPRQTATSPRRSGVRPSSARPSTDPVLSELRAEVSALARAQNRTAPPQGAR